MSTGFIGLSVTSYGMELISVYYYWTTNDNDGSHSHETCLYQHIYIM